MSSVHKIEIKNFVSNPYYLNNKKLFLELVNLINENPHKYSRKLLSKCTRKEYKDYSHLRNWIDSLIPQLHGYNYATKCYWIIYGLIDFPQCLNNHCNNKLTKQLSSFWYGYQQYCCNKCQATSIIVKDKRKQTCRKNLGVDYPTQSKQVISLRHKNNRRKYGTNEPCQCNKIKQQMKEDRLKKYNGKWELKSSKKKREQTNLKLYGHKCNLHGPIIEQQIKTKWKNEYKNGQPLSDPKVRNLGKQTCLKNYGVDCFSKSYEYKQLWKNEEWKTKNIEKQHNTKRKNKSFHISKREEQAYEILLTKYNKNDILRQYKSNEYPFLCDFFIISQSLYLECHFMWTHGGKPFDKTNNDDLMQLEYWKSKKSKFYENAIYTWTELDVKKLNIAQSNKLNYKCVYSLDELKVFLSSLN